MNQTTNKNTSIGCTVQDCAHHNKSVNCCSLSSIQVGCCGPAGTSCACTECDSYRKK